ncbi:MAG: hypothetical protein LUC93_14735 [Planctomycetaceae bacterium]|nr:hypothetical protein [Planctomycetaceae bacterium]
MAGHLGNEERFRLRPDLVFEQWDDCPDGRPRWLLIDPVANARAMVEWPESLIVFALRRGGTAAEIAASIHGATTLRPGANDVLSYIETLRARGWLWSRPPQPLAIRERNGRVASVFAHFLYWRIELWNPDGFLERTLGVVRVLASPPFLAAYLAIAALGIYMALPRWEIYLADASRLVTWQGLGLFIPALVLIKSFHELAHAYVAKAGGARVDAIGVALVVFFPLPFVDVGDAWRLRRSVRVRVAAAGVMAECILAGLALPLWAMAPPGALRGFCLFISGMALVSTLLVNLNPGARFDGYYIVSNLMGMENLRQRGTRYFTHFWHSRILGMKLTDPEPGLTANGRRALLAYSVYAWMYRIVLYFGLLLALYRFFPKVLGMGALAICVWVFFARPAAAESAYLLKNGGRMGVRSVFVFLAMAGVAFWAMAAVPHRLSFPAVAHNGRVAAIIAPRSGRLVMMRRIGEQDVVAGEVMASLEDPLAEGEQCWLQWRLEELRRSIAIAKVSPAHRRILPGLEAGFKAREQAATAWHAGQGLLEIVAPFSGRLAHWEDWAVPGVMVKKGSILGWLEDRDTMPEAIGLVLLDQAERLGDGGRTIFRPEDGGAPIGGTITRVERNRIDTLEDGILANAAGARFQNGVWHLERPMIRVWVRLDECAHRSGQSGTLWLWTSPYSLVGEAWRWMSALVVRESGF